MLKLIQAVRTRYILALIAMAILVTAAAGLMQFLLYEKQKDAEVINTAGMQRMLSQRMILQVHRLAEHEVNSSSYNDVYSQLQESIERFAHNHDFLTSLHEQQGAFSDELNQWYFSSPSKLDERSREFIGQLARLDLQEHQELDALYGISQTLLLDLDHAVKLFEQQSNQGVERLRYVELVIWALAISLLVLEIKFIFMPMEARIMAGMNELRHEKQKTEQALNVKSRFLARASHELRTPLQSILGYLDLYQQDKQASQLEQATISAKQLNVMVNEMHDFSGWDEGKVNLNVSAAKLSDTLDMASIPYLFAAQVKGLSLVKQLDADADKTVLCDHQHLAWVCSQLIDNAIKFSDKGKIIIRFQLHPENDYTRLNVRILDQGRGFSDAVITSLSLDDYKNNHFQGLQLGLIHCQRIIRAMSGEFTLFNAPEGGACVHFSIPVTISSEPYCESQLVSAIGKHALLVEDNMVNAVVLSKQFVQLGFKVRHAKHGKEAIDILRSESFDVIFMDLNMPHMDGFETIQWVRTQLNLDTPIIVVSANDEKRDIDKALSLGADAHVLKPLKVEELSKILYANGLATA